MNIFLVLLSLFCFLPSGCTLKLTPNVTVGSNNTGNYSEINKAIEAAPVNSIYRFVIYIKRGLYKEYVVVPRNKTNITFVGAGKQQTVISGNRSNGTNYKTDKSATLTVYGDGFFATALTVENIAGPKNHQAVALLSSSAQSAYYQVIIKGYQDSLYIKTGPQFFHDCDIYGTVDFIFGEGPAVLQNCRILARQALENQSNTITANGCENPHKKCGFSVHMCNIAGDKDLLGSKSPTVTYLGRPWKVNSTTVFMQSHMTEVINPMGWLRWNETFEKTLFYGEFNNSGTGAAVEKRVKWPGLHSVLDKNIANKFTVSEFINGEKWLDSFGINIPYTKGLL
ncbi:Plant invertase/pectin methylesterase inhibitor superfamily [Euphorbia peplus]|nr:Plant invertase/pectin methylesterase inhibitor superfamily [Euphorbia peplus]